MADDAAKWFAKQRSDKHVGESTAAFQAWLAEDPSRAEEISVLEETWCSLDQFAGSEALAAARTEALATSTANTWVRQAMQPKALAAIAASFLVFFSVSWTVQETLFGPDLYQTEVGQRLAITLEDGSAIELNTDTELRVAFTDSKRAVSLLRGQAYFVVAKDETRHFVVTTAQGAVTVTGTAFDVFAQADGETRVVLTEGRVRVTPTDQSTDAVLMPGQQVTFSETRLDQIASVDTTALAAWRSGRVVFNDTPLAEAVAEMNRYAETKVRLRDEDLDDLRVSGVFRTGQPDRFVAAMEQVFGLEAVTLKDGPIVLMKP